MAVTEYTTESFAEITGTEKNKFSFLRLFNTLLDEDRETKFLNIFRSYIINESSLRDISFYDSYEVSNGEYWDNVSFNLYGTPYLWWVIALLNNIANPFEELKDGDDLKVLRDDYVFQLTSDLEKIAED
jgi:hypothetical protein